MGVCSSRFLSKNNGSTNYESNFMIGNSGPKYLELSLLDLTSITYISYVCRNWRETTFEILHALYALVANYIPPPPLLSVPFGADLLHTGMK